MRGVEDELAREKRHRRVGEWLEAVDNGRGVEGLPGLELTEIRIRLASESDPMILLIVKGRVGDDKHIAFVGARDPGGALLAWRKRDLSGGLRWRREKAWGDTSGGGG